LTVNVVDGIVGAGAVCCNFRHVDYGLWKTEGCTGFGEKVGEEEIKRQVVIK